MRGTCCAAENNASGPCCVEHRASRRAPACRARAGRRSCGVVARGRRGTAVVARLAPRSPGRAHLCCAGCRPDQAGRLAGVTARRQATGRASWAPRSRWQRLQLSPGRSPRSAVRHHLAFALALTLAFVAEAMAAPAPMGPQQQQGAEPLLALDELCRLVARHTPVLHLHPRDSYMPCSADFFVAHSALRRRTAAGGWTELAPRGSLAPADLPRVQAEHPGEELQLELDPAARAGEPRVRCFLALPHERCSAGRGAAPGAGHGGAGVPQTTWLVAAAAAAALLLAWPGLARGVSGARGPGTVRPAQPCNCRTDWPTCPSTPTSRLY